MQKKIYGFCKICKQRIAVNLPSDFEVTAPDGLYVIVHIHGETIEDAHALIIEVDRNMNIRNTRVSDSAVFSLEI
ncbi:MAG: hypothetical protein ACTSU5_17115 [Promethearchaeota archaeon]